MRLTVLPLDERPVCTSLVADTAAAAGVEVRLPPTALLGQKKTPADVDALAAWLPDTASDAYVVSLDTLGFGGLIPSRTGDEPLALALSRWKVLSRLEAPVYAFEVVPRIPDADDPDEEPEFWGTHGRALHALSGQLATGRPLDARTAAIPQEVRRAWVSRRMRQHALALEALRMTAAGTLRQLVLGIDDASVGSFSSLAADDLSRWAHWLDVEHRASVHPGADEIGVGLVARAVRELSGDEPVRIAVACAQPGGLAAVAAFETGPVGQTARRQVVAAGGMVVADASEADAVLVVHAPHVGDWGAPVEATPEHVSRAEATVACVEQQELPVGLADTSAANGFDRTLLDLASPLLPSLDGLAGWNTAGNTLGTVAAQLVLRVSAARLGTGDDEAHRRNLAHRVLEDGAYMTWIRPSLRAWIGPVPGAHDHIEGAVADRALAEATASLDRALAGLPWAAGLSITPGSVRFPWDRTFEIDFELRSGGR